MRSPSIAPQNGPLHFVLDDFGKSGRAYREADPEAASFEDIVEDILSGQYNNPIQVLAVDTSAFRVEDVTRDVAKAVLKRSDSGHVGKTTQRFLEQTLGQAIPDLI
jgi:hypothetical protein